MKKFVFKIVDTIVVDAENIEDARVIFNNGEGECTHSEVIEEEA